MSKFHQMLPTICVLIIIASLVAGGIVWLMLPSDVPVHFSLSSNPDRYGSKVELLFCFIIPLFGLVRSPADEYYVDNEETKVKKIKDMKKANLSQLVITILCCGTFVFLFSLVIRNI